MLTLPALQAEGLNGGCKVNGLDRAVLLGACGRAVEDEDSKCRLWIRHVPYEKLVRSWYVGSMRDLPPDQPPNPQQAGPVESAADAKVPNEQSDQEAMILGLAELQARMLDLEARSEIVKERFRELVERLRKPG